MIKDLTFNSDSGRMLLVSLPNNQALTFILDADFALLDKPCTTGFVMPYTDIPKLIQHLQGVLIIDQE